MKLSQQVKDIRTRCIAKFGLPRGTEQSIEDIARAWAIAFAEQVCFELPGQGYGVKRASATRPIGKDTLAQEQDGGRLVCWDLFTGTGTGTPTLNEDPDSLDITGQVFVPVQSVNHLGMVIPTPQPPVDPTPLPPAQPSPDYIGHLMHVEELIKQGEDNNERRYHDIAARLAGIERVLAALANGFEGTVSLRYLGTGKIELHPKG